MNHKEAKNLAEGFIRRQKAEDIQNFKNIRKKLVSNPNIIQLFENVKDILNQREIRQVLFLNPLPIFFTEEYVSSKHFGVFSEYYNKIDTLGAIPKCCSLELRCGYPGIVLLGEDWIHELHFSNFHLPNYFEDELVLSAFIIELQGLIPNYNAITLIAYRDSDYGITTHDLSSLAPCNKEQFNTFMENYLFDYYIVDSTNYTPKDSVYMAKHCIKIFDYGITTPLGGIGFNRTHGTIGIASQKDYPLVSKTDGRLGEFPYYLFSTYSDPHFSSNKRRIVGIRLESIMKPQTNIEPSLNWV